MVRNADGVDDLPRRDDGTAVIGDARNDENLILARLHVLFLKFHNRCLDTGLAAPLAEAQQLTRWHRRNQRMAPTDLRQDAEGLVISRSGSTAGHRHIGPEETPP